MGGRLRSRNIHSEIVYCLGYTNNIATTLNCFGISEKTRDLLVVRISCPPLGLNNSADATSVESHLRENVHGDFADFDDKALSGIVDTQKVKKIYKLGLSNEGGKARRRKDGSIEGKAGSGNSEGESDPSEKKELEIQILGLMAIRGYA